MHTQGNIERGVAVMHALDSISYLANNLARWSHKADASGLFMTEGYIKLLEEDYAKLGQTMAKLRQAIAPAPVQDVARETMGEAA